MLVPLTLREDITLLALIVPHFTSRLLIRLFLVDTGAESVSYINISP